MSLSDHSDGLFPFHGSAAVSSGTHAKAIARTFFIDDTLDDATIESFAKFVKRERLRDHLASIELDTRSIACRQKKTRCEGAEEIRTEPVISYASRRIHTLDRLGRSWSS